MDHYGLHVTENMEQKFAMCIFILCIILPFNVALTPGTLLWSFKTGGAVWSSPTVSNGVVYVGFG